MILLVKAKYVDPSQMDLFGGDAPLQQKKTWVRHPKTGKMFQKTVYVRTDKNEAIRQEKVSERNRTKELPPGQWRMTSEDKPRSIPSEKMIDRLIEQTNPQDLPRNIDQWQTVRDSYQKTLDAMLHTKEHRSREIENQQAIIDRVDRLLVGLRNKLDQDPGQNQKSSHVDPALDPENVKRMAEGAQKRHAHDSERRRKWHEENPLDTSKLADWTKLDGYDVLRVPGGRYAALPVTGRRDARTFSVFDVNERNEILQVRRDDVHRWLKDAENTVEKGSYVRFGDQIGRVVSRNGESLVVDIGGREAFPGAWEVDVISEAEFKEAAKQRISKLRKDSADYRKQAAEFNRKHGGKAARLKTRVQTFSDDHGTGIIPTQHSTGKAYEEIQKQANASKRTADQLENMAGLQPKKQSGERLKIRKIKFAPMSRSSKVTGSYGNAYEVTNMPDEILKKMGWKTVGFEPGPQQRYFAVTDSGIQHLFESSSDDTIAKLKELVEEPITDDRVKRFDGGEVELDYDDNRIRIRHDEKPSAEVRSQLKSRGFRWSPKNGAWQRQLTDNAKRVTSQITGVEL